MSVVSSIDVILQGGLHVIALQNVPFGKMQEGKQHFPTAIAEYAVTEGSNGLTRMGSLAGAD